MGEAIVAEAQVRGFILSEPEAFEAFAGHGTRTRVDGHDVLVGTSRWIASQGIALGGAEEAIARLQSEAKTAIAVAIDGQITGVIGVADTVKEGSAEAIAGLKRLGLDVIMLTGDNRRTAQAIAGQVGVEHVLAEVLPGDKAAQVKALQGSGIRGEE